MASQPTVKQSIILHAEMISFIGLSLVPAMFSQFKTNAQPYLFPIDLAQAEGAVDILRSLEIRGYLSTGNYDTLIRILGSSHLIQLQAEVQSRARQIRRQIVLENGGPSQPSTSPPPDATRPLSLAAPSEPTHVSPVSDNVRKVKEESDRCRSHSSTKIQGLYVETTHYTKTKEVFEQHNSVLVIGTSGSGKSFILHYMSANPLTNYLPISCKQPKEIKKYLDLVQGTDIQLLFVVDEPFGSSYLQSNLLDTWVNVGPELERYLGEHKFVFATRQSVWKDCKVHLENNPFFTNSVEVTSATLTVDDKYALLKAHLGGREKLTTKEIGSIISQENPIAFGQGCKLLSDAIEKDQTGAYLVQIFNRPFSYLCSELNKMADKDKEKYATLSLVMLSGGELECKQLRGTLSDVKPDVKEIIDVVVDVCECPNLTCGGLQKCADKLTGTHLEKIHVQATKEDSSSHQVYKFSHDSIQEAVTMQYGERHPEHCLKYLKADVVVNIVRPHNYKKREQEFAINFPPESYKELAGMFTTKVIDEHGKSGLSKVFDNPCVKDESFQSVWVDCLKNSSRGKRTAFTLSKDYLYGGRCVLYHLARSGAHTVLSFVCPDRQSECKCRWYLPCVLRGAISGNHVQLVRERLSDRPLTELGAGQAVNEAVRSDSTDVLSVLFDQTSVHDHVTMARSGLRIAGICGRVRLADYLLTHHCSPCRGLQHNCPCVDGLKYAIEYGQTAIVTLIESHRKTGH